LQQHAAACTTLCIQERVNVPPRAITGLRAIAQPVCEGERQSVYFLGVWKLPGERILKIASQYVGSNVFAVS